MYHLDRKETISKIIKLLVKLIKVKVTKKETHNIRNLPLLLWLFGLFTNSSILHDNVGWMQVGHGFDAVVNYTEGGGYYFWSIVFDGLDNVFLVGAVSVKLFILRLHIRYFCDMCILILLEYPYFSSKIRDWHWEKRICKRERVSRRVPSAFGSGRTKSSVVGKSRRGDGWFVIPPILCPRKPAFSFGRDGYVSGFGGGRIICFIFNSDWSSYFCINTPPDWLFVSPPPSASTWVFKYIFTWSWVGIKYGLVSKLVM